LALAWVVGLRGNAMIISVAISTAESGRRYWAHGHNGPTRGCSQGSIDRGLWQVNDCYHPGTSNRCAYEPRCNAGAMRQISSGGTNWRPWSTFNVGVYRRYMAEVATRYSAGRWRTLVKTWGAVNQPITGPPPPPGIAELAAIDPTPKVRETGRKLTAAYRPTSDALDAVTDLLRR